MRALARVFTTAAIIATAATPVFAQFPNCGDDRGVDRCDAEQQARVRDLFGVPTIETHATAGDEVRRAFYVDGYGRDIVAIVFIRSPGREPIVSVHIPKRENAQATPPLVASVADRVWTEVIDRSALFDRRLAPLSGTDADAPGICLHGWIYTIEAVGPRVDGTSPSQRARTASACTELASIYSRDLDKAALSQLPYCAGLDAKLFRNDAEILQACGKLRMDRNTAAAVLTRAEELMRVGDDGRRAESLAGWFHMGANVEWSGESHAPSDDDVFSTVRFWQERYRASDTLLDIETVDGLNADVARLRGTLWRWVYTSNPPNPADPRYRDIANVEMIWERAYGDFRLAEFLLGSFQRVQVP